MELTQQQILSHANAGLHPGLSITRGHLHSSYAGPSDLAAAPRITRALVEGDPQEILFLGAELFEELPRDSWKVTIIEEDDSHLLVYDTERGLEGVRARGKFIPSTKEFEMAMFAFELGIDVRLFRVIADAAFRLPFGAALRARRAVELDLENRRALALSTPALWPAQHRADQTGAEWNLAGGDFKAAVELGIEQILSVNNGYSREQIDFKLSRVAFRAAQQDPTWLAWRANISDNTITDVAMADYLQLRSVIVRDATVSVAEVTQSLWGESAYLVLDTGAADLNTEFGVRPFARMHRMRNAVVFQPYLDNQRGTQYWPFEDMALPVVHNFTTAFFLFDMVG